MKRFLAIAAFCSLYSWSTAGDAPIQTTVRQLLEHPADYDNRLVDVTGYYVCGEHASDLWPDAPTANSGAALEHRVYIDPVTWDPRYHPKRSKDISDPWHVTGRRARVIGTFRSVGVRPGISIPPDSPTIVNVTYFRRAR